jgi:hypothetical protein
MYARAATEHVAAVQTPLARTANLEAPNGSAARQPFVGFAILRYGR